MLQINHLFQHFLILETKRKKLHNPTDKAPDTNYAMSPM